MPRPSLQTEIKLSSAIERFLDENPMTTAMTVVEAVEKETGIRPSLTMVYNHINNRGMKKVWVKEG